MNKRIREMLEERQRLAEEAGRILSRAEGEKRQLSGEEQAQFDALHEKIASLKTDADALAATLAKQAAVEEELEAARTVPASGAEGRGARGGAESRVMQAFRRALVVGKRELSGEELRALQVDSPTAGGYIVAPQEFTAALIKAVDDATFVRQVCTVLPVTAAESLGAASLDADPADADWTTELGTGSEDSTMAFGRRELKPYPLAKRLKVSAKLLRMATAADALVRDRMAYKFAVTLEKAVLTGSGAGRPLGVFTASNDGIPTSRDVATGNAATYPTLDGLIEAKYALKAGYWARARWVFHRDGVKLIAKLKDGEGRPALELAQQAGMPDRLLGFPLHVSEYGPSTFTSALYAGIVGDFSYYWIAEAQAFALQVLTELYAETNQVGYIGRLEADGMPVLAEAFARVKLG
ncbi:MAG: Phage capsid family protein [Acidobacteria bacterium ADurb.Bin051]|nr:MAG: Phage capsid family protein [Acidobacteria bacterium ADurb.Bin051]